VKKGHKVSIYDSGEQIGGQLLCCAKEQRGGERYRMLIDYFEEQISRSDIEVHLGVRMDQNLIHQTHTEVIVLATGSKFERPAVQGIDYEHVYDVIDVMANGIIPPGDKAVVIHGGKVGIVVALYLAAQGKQVTVVHEGKSVYEKVISTYRWRYRSWLKEYNVDTLTRSRLTAVTSGSVRISDDESTESQIEADFVVLAERTANQDLFDYIELNSDEFHVIGDAIRPGFQVTAFHGGHRLGCRI
jgi:NADPH-dependent 2,4-dienoyl-CoA reductase/sulfur reductase-like enzyme